MDIKLKNLEMLIQQCWSRAEDNVIQAVAQRHHAPQEDEITFLFCGELRREVEGASNAGSVEAAFLADLLQSIPALGTDITRRIHGLVARVNRHPRWHEGKVSGADLGVVVVRPVVRLGFGGTEIKFIQDHARGLLAQAKLGRQTDPSRNGHEWNGLTKPQEKLYPKRRDYYSLLLYRLRGSNADELRVFGWQLCEGHTIRHVKKWLRSDVFPAEILSSEVLKKLFDGSIGTDNPKIIERVIDPPKSEARSVTIHIFWPDGKGPPPSLPLHLQQHGCQQVQQRVRA
jgi:hypothetical protein